MKVETMESIPAGSNPFHHDQFRQGTRINERFVAMFVNHCPEELVIVDLETGLRKKLTFPKKGTWKEAPQPAAKKITWKDISPKGGTYA